MKPLQRTGPLQAVMPGDPALWLTEDGMPQVRRHPGEESARLDAVGLCDVSAARRFGVKGAGTADWLRTQGLDTPAHPNRWLRGSGGELVLRLGLTEYLIEAAPGSKLVQALAAATAAPKVYPVARFDAALVLTGPRVFDLLAQTCAFDFAALAVAERSVVLTSMVGVGVTVMRDEAEGPPLMRLWCDGSWGEFLWTTLVEVAQSLGGGAVGRDALAARLAREQTGRT